MLRPPVEDTLQAIFPLWGLPPPPFPFTSFPSYSALSLQCQRSFYEPWKVPLLLGGFATRGSLQTLQGFWSGRGVGNALGFSFVQLHLEPNMGNLVLSSPLPMLAPQNWGWMGPFYLAAPWPSPEAIYLLHTYFTAMTKQTSMLQYNIDAGLQTEILKLFSYRDGFHTGNFAL